MLDGTFCHLFDRQHGISHLASHGEWIILIKLATAHRALPSAPELGTEHLRRPLSTHTPQALVVPEPSDAGTPGFGWSSPSPSQSSGGNHVESRAQRAASKRRAASEWIGMALGVSVPHETDQAFRRALADGVTLCRLVNWLRPGSIPKVPQGCCWCCGWVKG